MGTYRDHINCGLPPTSVGHWSWRPSLQLRLRVSEYEKSAGGERQQDDIHCFKLSYYTYSTFLYLQIDITIVERTAPPNIFLSIYISNINNINPFDVQWQSILSIELCSPFAWKGIPSFLCSQLHILFIYSSLHACLRSNSLTQHERLLTEFFFSPFLSILLISNIAYKFCRQSSQKIRFYWFNL